eukprot:g8791.t1
MPVAYVKELQGMSARPAIKVPTMLVHGELETDQGGSALWRMKEWEAAEDFTVCHYPKGLGHSLEIVEEGPGFNGLECVKKGVDVNARLDAYGGTALFLAIEQGNWSMVKWLIEEAGVDMEVLDYGGYNALDYAAACHWHHPDRPPQMPDGKLAPMDIASYLKSQGMKYTWFGAALAEDIDRLWEFLDNGQDERGGHFNKSALEEAADNGGYWTAKFLMVKGAQVSVTPNWIYAMAPESSCTANIQGKLGKCFVAAADAVQGPKLRRYFTKTQEWFQDEGEGTGVVGITHLAQRALGEIVYCRPGGE